MNKTKKNKVSKKPINISEYYPINHNGVRFDRKDCSREFRDFYEGAGIGRAALHMGSLYYLMDGMYLSPDGEMVDF
jgi:hypothetical protein